MGSSKSFICKPILFCFFFLAGIYFLSPLALKGQSKSFSIKQERASAASTTSTEGLPERGAFRFDYGYNGEDIVALVRISRNGKVIAELNGLKAISSATLAELNVARGDNLELFVEFGIVSATVNVDNALQGSPAGDWRYSSGFNFFLIGPEGNVQKFLGTMNFAYQLTPPWNGIEVKAEPPVIGQGEASTITLQSIEAPGTPVMVPDVTYINLQVGIIGRLAGGISLPEFGLRYTAGFSNAPYGLITDTPILYEAFPDSIAPLPIDSAAVPIVAFSPFNTEINGSTRVSVKGEEELGISLEIAGAKEIWPTLTVGTAEGGDSNRNPNPNNRNKIEKIIVKVTKGNDPVSEKKVIVHAEIELPSTGHQHVNTPVRTDLGKFKNLVSGDESFKQIEAETNEDGEIMLEYQASQISSEYSIVSYIKNKPEISDSDQIFVRVPGLLNFASFGTDRWNLTGNTGTTSYSRCRGTKIKHLQNHYASENLFGNLYNALRHFYLWSGKSEEDGGYGQFLKLSLNDMSIPQGGVFDICSDWGVQGRSKIGHHYHRIGASVDIDTRAKILGEDKVVNLLSQKLPNGKTLLEKLKFYVDRNGGERYPEATIHFGFGGN